MSELMKALQIAVSVAEQRGDRLHHLGDNALAHEEAALAEARKVYWAEVTPTSSDHGPHSYVYMKMQMPDGRVIDGEVCKDCGESRDAFRH